MEEDFESPVKKPLKNLTTGTKSTVSKNAAKSSNSVNKISSRPSTAAVNEDNSTKTQTISPAKRGKFNISSFLGMQMIVREARREAEYDRIQNEPANVSSAEIIDLDADATLNKNKGNTIEILENNKEVLPKQAASVENELIESISIDDDDNQSVLLIDSDSDHPEDINERFNRKFTDNLNIEDIEDIVEEVAADDEDILDYIMRCESGPAENISTCVCGLDLSSLDENQRSTHVGHCLLSHKSIPSDIELSPKSKVEFYFLIFMIF